MNEAGSSAWDELLKVERERRIKRIAALKRRRTAEFERKMGRPLGTTYPHERNEPTGE